MRKKFHVEVLQDGKWGEHSSHNNREYADVAFEVQSDIGKEVRIKHNGKVVRPDSP